MSNRKPTVVLVPGAWHTPAHYSTLISHLESSGFTVLCNQNLSTDATNPGITNRDDAAAIRKTITTLPADEKVVVAMHSYGGIPGSEAAYNLPNVVGLLFFAAFVMPEGKSASDAPPHGNTWAVPAAEEGFVTTIRSKEVFYNGVSDADAETAIAALKTQTMASLGTPSGPTAWQQEGVRKAYALAGEDSALLLPAQEIMVEQAGGWEEVKRFECGHSPWMVEGEKRGEFLEWFGQTVEKFGREKA